ncbi:transmembrane protein, putative [Medicago truncatula]|uniref:Transmembrane protein, putative n=1 Tax=Medicago truncatula TaxID=3880 RepID=A0A072VET1_MEDTR|nr:transmembrane protein, putative [Medicago truncatula]
MKTYANVPPRETPKMRLTHLHSKSVVYWPFHIHVSQYILLLSIVQMRNRCRELGFNGYAAEGDKFTVFLYVSVFCFEPTITCPTKLHILPDDIRHRQSLLYLTEWVNGAVKNGLG